MYGDTTLLSVQEGLVMLQPGGRHGTMLCIPRQCPAAAPQPGTTFCHARPRAVGSGLKTPLQRRCRFSRAKLEMLLRCQTLDQSLRVHGLEANTRSTNRQRNVTSAGDGSTWRTQGDASWHLHPEEWHVGEEQWQRGHRGTTDLLGILAAGLLKLSLFIYFRDHPSGERMSPWKGKPCCPSSHLSPPA